MDATELVFLMVKSITLKQVTNGGLYHWLTRDVPKLKKIYGESTFHITKENIKIDLI